MPGPHFHDLVLCCRVGRCKGPSKGRVSTLVDSNGHVSELPNCFCATSEISKEYKGNICT